MANRVGQQFGNYRLVRLLGRGGFAEVYLGEHQRLGTQAAIKVLYTYLSDHDADAFLTEARTIGTLEHPHVIRVLDFDVQEGIPFLVMSYAPNGTLRQRHPKGSHVPLDTIVEYVTQVTDALQYAHDEKLIHRDIKPENMLLGRHNEVLLSDFGLARIAQSSLLQSTQEVTGTVYYMAPEQFQGKARLASDQYSLGVVVYEWICGARPFQGSFAELYSQHLFVPPPPLHEKVPTISPIVEQVVLTALAKDPKERFASVKAFARALEQACQVATTHSVTLTSEIPESDQPLPTGTVATISSNILSQPPDVVSPSSQAFSPSDVPYSSSQIASQPPPSSPLQPDPQPTLPARPIEPAKSASNLNTQLHSHAPSLKAPASVVKLGSKATIFNILASSKVSWPLGLVVLIIIATSIGWNYLSLTNGTSAIHSTATATPHPTARAITDPTAQPTAHPPVTVNYAMFGFDVEHTHFNPNEHMLTPINVSHFVQDWTFRTGGWINSSPTVVNDIVYVGSDDGKLYAFKASTGKPLWIASTDNKIDSSPTVANGIVYVGSYDSKLYAFSASGCGSPTCFPLWTASTGDAINSSPTVTNGIIYVGSQDGKLYAFKASGCGSPTCTPLWTASTGQSIYYSSPTVVNGIVYVGSQDGKLYAFKASGCGSSSCTPLWTATVGNYIRSSPTVAGGVVYVGSDDDNLYAFNSSGCGNSSCSPLWIAHTGNLIYSSPAVINGVVYVGSKDQNLYAFHLPGTVP